MRIVVRKVTDDNNNNEVNFDKGEKMIARKLNKNSLQDEISSRMDRRNIVWQEIDIRNNEVKRKEIESRINASLDSIFFDDNK